MNAIVPLQPGCPRAAQQVRSPLPFDIRRIAFESNGADLMDRITENLLSQFSAENEIESMPEEKRFERFTAFSVIRRHFNRSFEIEDVIVGGGGDRRHCDHRQQHARYRRGHGERDSHKHWRTRYLVYLRPS